LSVIVAPPLESTRVAPLALERMTSKLSRASPTVSPTIGTEIVFVVSPAAKVSVPLVAT
jgi:hypothetical protein